MRKGQLGRLVIGGPDLVHQRPSPCGWRLPVPPLLGRRSQEPGRTAMPRKPRRRRRCIVGQPSARDNTVCS
jgi:hypothetical protein